MEALQMLKFSLKQDRLNLMEGRSTTEDMMLDIPLDDEDHILARLAAAKDTAAISRLMVYFDEDDDVFDQ